MIHEPTDPPDSRGALRRIKDKHNADLRAELVNTATQIVEADGSNALTMQRLAAEFGSSVGTLYRHFGSKTQLLAEIDAARLGELARTAQSRADAFDTLLGTANQGSIVGSLARVLAASWLWIDATNTTFESLLHVRHVVGDPTVTPKLRSTATAGVLQPLATALASASEAGALTEGDIGVRAALIATIVSTPVCAPPLWGSAIRDADLGSELLDCLLGHWGAGQRELSEARILAAGLSG